MIKVMRPSLNTKEKSVELKFLNGLSTLHTNVCSYTRSIELGIGPIQIWQLRYHSYVFPVALVLLFIFFNFLDAFIDFEYSLFIVNVINATFWHIFVSNKLVLHLLE